MNHKRISEFASFPVLCRGAMEKQAAERFADGPPAIFFRVGKLIRLYRRPCDPVPTISPSYPMQHCSRREWDIRSCCRAITGHHRRGDVCHVETDKNYVFLREGNGANIVPASPLSSIVLPATPRCRNRARTREECKFAGIIYNFQFLGAREVRRACSVHRTFPCTYISDILRGVSS